MRVWHQSRVVVEADLVRPQQGLLTFFSASGTVLRRPSAANRVQAARATRAAVPGRSRAVGDRSPRAGGAGGAARVRCCPGRECSVCHAVPFPYNSLSAGWYES